MNLRKAAVTLAMGGAALTLVGVGVGASFTDSATATENISVGTFGIQLNPVTAGMTVIDSHHIALTIPALQSSAAGSAPMVFTVTNTGTIPATITVTAGAVSGDSNFTAIAGPTAFVVNGSATSANVSVGLSWPVLSNADLGASATVVYTISAVG
ncbi:MAG: hypothetical protein WB808_13125 [Candidatus Dormiibacterota bacterium]